MERIQITPPYDIRPATKFDIENLMKLLISTFGNNANFIDINDIILLNSVGSEDKMDEIIYAGKVIGLRRYDLLKRRWILKLNGLGLSLLQDKIGKGWVKVDNVASEKIKEGANVLVPGIIDLDKDIKTGDYIAILDENGTIIAGGITRIDASQLKELKKGVFAKNYCVVKETFSPKIVKKTWQEIALINASKIKEEEERSISFIKKVVKEKNKPVIVSFSGGKDSLVTLSLVKKALPKHSFKVLFVDTGLEFPETLDYVKKSMKFFDVEDDFIFEAAKENIFWEAFKKFGPPGRDFRYCCKISKLAPIKKALSSFGDNNKVLSFVGQRRYESFIRSQRNIWQNQYIPNQLNVSPVQNWNALMIWLYIFLYELPYNPLYEEGYDRIGCWLCPASDMAHFEIINRTHPKLYEKLMQHIETWIECNSLPKAFIDIGLWRFRYIPKKILNLIPGQHIKSPIHKNIIKDIKVENVKSCRSTPVTIEGIFDAAIELKTIKESFALIGRNKYYPQHNFIYLDTDRITAFFYSDGRFKVILNDKTLKKEELKAYLEVFFGTIFRSYECLRCELCVSECPTSAIVIKEGVLTIDQNYCTHCYRCFNVCPIVNITRRWQIKQAINNITEKLK